MLRVGQSNYLSHVLGRLGSGQHFAWFEIHNVGQRPGHCVSKLPKTDLAWRSRLFRARPFPGLGCSFFPGFVDIAFRRRAYQGLVYILDQDTDEILPSVDHSQSWPSCSHLAEEVVAGARLVFFPL